MLLLFRVKMAKEQPTVNLVEFSTAIRDRLLNLISWAKAVPGTFYYFCYKLIFNYDRILGYDADHADTSIKSRLAWFAFIGFGILLAATVISLFTKSQIRNEFHHIIDVISRCVKYPCSKDHRLWTIHRWSFNGKYGLKFMQVITNDFVLTSENSTELTQLKKLLESARKLLVALAQAKLGSNRWISAFEPYTEINGAVSNGP